MASFCPFFFYRQYSYGYGWACIKEDCELWNGEHCSLRLPLEGPDVGSLGRETPSEASDG